MLTKRKVQTTIILVFGILILINLLSTRLFFRWDFTADQRYSLSKATIDILENLNEPVTITAYFSENLPPDIEQVRNDFRDLLVEYSTRSGGNVVYEFVNPNESREIEIKAQQSGISPIMINVREKDQLKQQKAYMGAVIQMGNRQEVIPFIQPGAAMEYELSTNIKKLAITEKPKIALLQGNGEPSLNAMPQLRKSLSIMYDVETFEFSDTAGIPEKYKTLLIIAPTDTIKDKYLEYLDEFVKNGGKLLIALNKVKGDLNKGMAEKIYTGLGDWLKKYGVEVEDNLVIDANCTNIMVQQRQGIFIMNTPVSFPYIPIITNFTEHPITKGLEAVLMPFVSSIKINPADTALSIVPLATTSEKSGIEKPPVYFNVTRQWKKSDFGIQSLPVAVAVEGNKDGKHIKMVVFGDGDFVVNGEGREAQRLEPDNISFMVNAIDWLSDDTGLVELRTKGVTARPIDPSLEEGTKTFLKYLNFLLPIVLVILYGIFRYNRRKKIREKLKNTRYV